MTSVNEWGYKSRQSGKRLRHPLENSGSRESGATSREFNVSVLEDAEAEGGAKSNCARVGYS